MATTISKPTNLADLRDSGWQSKNVKREIYDNLLVALCQEEDLFPGIVGYDDTVIPEIVLALLSGHDMLLLGEKGQAKSRLMRQLTRFLDESIPYVDLPELPVHEDPYHPITDTCRRFLAETPEEDVPIAWWPREHRYAERLSPGTKFADVIGEIDPAKLAGGESMSAEGALHFGLIPRMHRGIFAMNELPELDELVQVGLFNILEERDVQIRGFPISFDIDVFRDYMRAVRDQGLHEKAFILAGAAFLRGPNSEVPQQDRFGQRAGIVGEIRHGRLAALNGTYPFLEVARRTVVFDFGFFHIAKYLVAAAVIATRENLGLGTNNG